MLRDAFAARLLARRLLALWRLRPALLLLTAAALCLLLAAAALLLPLRAVLAAAAAAGAAILFSLRALALLELGELARHELARLRVLLQPELIVSAIRAAAPPLGIRPVALLTKDAFR